ncbi:hypothetical protein CR969_01705 [Candidatus Saccharibacteria bacterium]|nr:MAG: hypothetical protein CR969_01705 [Candidatus Saccharibacteria bacterium]
MSVVILFAIILAVVFVIAFVSSRRFGPLALALAAGSMLAEFWTEWLSIVIGGLGVSFPGLSDKVIATIILLLSPLFLLLLGGPKYYGKHEKVISALAIAILTSALLVRPLGMYMTLDGDALAVYKTLSDWWQYVVTVGLLLGLFDLFLLHNAKLPKPKKH